MIIRLGHYMECLPNYFMNQLPMNIDKKLKEIEKRIEEICVNDKSLVKKLVKKYDLSVI